MHAPIPSLPDLSLPVGLAPMAALTDPPFRKTLALFSPPGWMVTEMISVEAIARHNRNTLRMMEADRLPVPQWVQLFGARPQTFAFAARWVESHTGYSGIDLNMGCPVPKVTKREGGAGLLRNPDLMVAIIRAVREACSLPVSVKIRLGWDQVTFPNWLPRLEEAGASAVTLHFRLASDFYHSRADWSWAPLARELLSIPLIGNGDLTSEAEIRRGLNACTAVMIGRGAIMDPFIFRKLVGNAPTSEDWILFLSSLAQEVEQHCPPGLALHRLKAYARFLTHQIPSAREWRKMIFTTQDWGSLKSLFTTLPFRPEESERHTSPPRPIPDVDSPTGSVL